MAKYSIKGPDGSSYDIEGPDGASDEDVINAVLASDAYKSSPGTQKNLQSEQARNPDIIVPGQTSPTPAQRQAVKPKSIWQQRLEEAQGVRPGLDPENEFGGPRVFDNGISNPLSAVRDIADLGARGMEYLAAGTNTGLDYLDEASRRTGLADALSVDGNKFLPGSAIGALMEAFPLGGAEAGKEFVGVQLVHAFDVAMVVVRQLAGLHEAPGHLQEAEAHQAGAQRHAQVDDPHRHLQVG